MDSVPHASDMMLEPYIGLKINYKARKAASTYCPSALMMDYIIHEINDLLVDNFYFRQASPNYNPYILRLYYGVVFWIQCLRAGRAANNQLDAEAHQALILFLDAYPPESLPISGPLLYLFKTLCCSTPEIGTYGKVYPFLPSAPGPESRSDFISDDLACFILPNVPGIFALLSNLNSFINPTDQQQPQYPQKGKHIPVTSEAISFGHHFFPVLADRTNKEKWSLVSSGLQYPCEADKKLHESFAERFADFGFPDQAATDDLSSFASFLHMTDSRAWFAQVRDVAATEASFFEGSGTLGDCFPEGIPSNQVVVHYQEPDKLPTAPSCSADRHSLFPFSIQLKSSSRTLPQVAEAMAALSQTNIQMFARHPYFPNLGSAQRTGPFWDITPVESSFKDESSYLSLHGIIRGLMKPNK